jgi:hypothetical protein
MYEEDGVYEYNGSLVLFKDGKFLMFGWEVPLTLGDRNSETTIDAAKIGELVIKLPIRSKP